jgi:hypothetical protein
LIKSKPIAPAQLQRAAAFTCGQSRAAPISCVFLLVGSEI